jgi:hypothetical protein
MLGKMNLYRFKIFLAQSLTTATKFCKKNSINRVYLYQILAGKHKPSKKYAKMLERATHGFFKAEELLNETPTEFSVGESEKECTPME